MTSENRRTRPAAGHEVGASKTAVLGWLTGLVVFVLVVVLVILLVTPSTSKSSKAGNGSLAGTGATGPTGPASTSGGVAVVHAVPASVLDTVGVGGHLASRTAADDPLTIIRARTPELPKVSGRPVLFFLGADWCPFCATERWSLIIALSRFGTLSGLRPTSSSPDDFAPNTQTFTFASLRYKSSYLVFEPVEVEDANRHPLQTPNAAQVKVLQAWDPPESFPFLFLAGRYVGGLPNWDDPIALAGLSRSQIAAATRNPRSSVGATIDANANYLTAGICAVDGGRPRAVCGSAAVKAAAVQLAREPAATPLQG